EIAAERVLGGSVTREILPFADDNAANGVTGTEGADHAMATGRQIILVLVKGNDRACRTGVGIFIQHYRRFLLQIRITAQQLAGDQHVHVQVGLVQPEAAHVGHRQLELFQVLADQLGDHRADFTEYLAAFLNEEFVRLADTAFVGPVEEAEVVADVIGELGQQLGADDLELMLGDRILSPLDNDRGARIAEDKVTVTVTEVHMTGADLGVDHQHRTRLTRAYGIGGGLDTEGGRRAGNVHIEAEPLDTQSGLHFHSDSRIGPLQIGAGNDHAIDIRSGAAGTLQGFGSGLHRHFAEDRPLVIAALGNIRNHAVDIEDTAL